MPIITNGTFLKVERIWEGKIMNQRKVVLRLLKSASVLAVIPATGLLVTPAFAQSEPTTANGSVQASTDATGTDIVVTGTRIRGVAPVGSSVIQLDQKSMEKTGQLSTADILARVPAVLTLGSGNSYAGGSSQNADLNALSFNKSPNLRGFGPQATLSLVNGHRVPYDGANMNTFDGDNLPVQMLQRVDIVADGGSALYGADAITVTAPTILINTGSEPILPAIPGLADSLHLVSSTDLIKKDRLPKRLVIIGGGYLGLEFAGIYRKFGAEVTVLESVDRFLPREDRDVADAVTGILSGDGIELVTSAAVASGWKLEITSWAWEKALSAASPASSIACAICCSWSTSSCPADTILSIPAPTTSCRLRHFAASSSTPCPGLERSMSDSSASFANWAIRFAPLLPLA